MLALATALAMAWLFWPALAERRSDDARQDWRVTSLDAHASLDRTGRLDATIDFTVDFADREAHGIWIALPRHRIRHGSSDDHEYHRYTQIHALSGTGAPNDVTTRTRDDAIEVRVGDPDRTVTGVQRYRLGYVAEGLVSPDPEDRSVVLRWQVVPSYFQMPIDDVDVQLQMPSDLEDLQSYTGSGRPATSRHHFGRIGSLHQDHLDPGESLGIDGRMAHGSVLPATVPAPFSDGDVLRPSQANVVGSLAVALIAGTIQGRRWRDSLTRQDRERTASDSTRRQLREDGIHPAEMVALAEGTVGPKAMRVAVLHAIRDGAIVIRAIGSSGASRTHRSGRGSLPRKRRSNWTLERGKPPSDPITVALVNGLFSRRDAVTTQELRRRRLRPPLAGARREIGRSVQAKGWFRHDPVGSPRRWNIGATGLLVLGVLEVWACLVQQWRAGWPGLFLAAAALLAFVVSDRPRARTAEGLRVLDEHDQTSLSRVAPEDFRTALSRCISRAAGIATVSEDDGQGSGFSYGGGFGGGGGGGW